MGRTQGPSLRRRTDVIVYKFAEGGLFVMSQSMWELEQLEAGVAVHVEPGVLLASAPEVPSSKYYTLRYVLAAALAEGESRIVLPARSDDSDALFRGCRALGAQLNWEDDTQRVLRVRGAGQGCGWLFTRQGSRSGRIRCG